MSWDWKSDGKGGSGGTLQVRTPTNDDGTAWSGWQNLEQEVGHRSLAIQEESEWHLYTGSSNFVGCIHAGPHNGVPEYIDYYDGRAARTTTARASKSW